MKLWIARDKDGCLHLFGSLPICSCGMWEEQLYIPREAEGCGVIYIENPNLFPKVTFENSPQEVELKLIEK